MRTKVSQPVEKSSRSRAFIFTAIAILTLFVCSFAEAQSVRIVAFGASNTAGKGVGTQVAWPAQLEALLRAKGYDARVTNAGISGDDLGGMLARLGRAIPDGTQLVIMEKAATNSRRRGIKIGAAVSEITGRLRSRGIKLIVIPGMRKLAGNRVQADGIHITAEGHAVVAAKLLPQVTTAIGRPGGR